MSSEHWNQAQGPDPKAELNSQGRKENQNSSAGKAVSCLAQEPCNINLCASVNCTTSREITG
ncbi:hypothetical protein STEG23_010588, partial [Scotinomys teguina]